MNQITLIFLSIIFGGVFGEAIESHAQFSLAKENYHTSFMSPIIVKGCTSFASSTIVTPDSNEKCLTIVDKIIFIPVGLVFGTFHGLIASIVIPGDDFSNGIKGGMIGFCIGPFLSYEMFAATRGVKNPLHKFYIKTGGNLTLTNYEDSQISPCFSIGMGRHYHLWNGIGLRGEISYGLRRFHLPAQKISYAYYFDRVVKTYDIDFSVGYINTSILLNFKILSLQKLNFYLSLGPSLSLAVRDATKFHFIREEENPDDFDFSYIEREGPLFGYPAMVYQLELQMGKWIWQIGFHNSVTDTDEIYPLDSNTRLRTVELSVGYKL
ncbi:PorT family protein [candidate division KSB1 bacterium]|nr:PorT family protein [candidate division KSB1 bacterium]